MISPKYSFYCRPAAGRVAAAPGQGRGGARAAPAAIWEATARIVGSPLLLPGFLTTVAAFGQGVTSGELPLRTLASLPVLVPAAFPAILAGLKIGWAFAWRTLIAAELVFGVSSRSGGLGWFIYVNRNQLETASVFAGLLAIILIGLLVESLLFRTLSRLTVERWGTQNP